MICSQKVAEKGPYPLAAPGVIVIIASPKVSHRIAANLRAPSFSLAGLPQAPEASFRPVASEWVTPHSYRVFGLPKSRLKAFALPLCRRVLQALARVLAFLSTLNHFEAPPEKKQRQASAGNFAPPLGFLLMLAGALRPCENLSTFPRNMENAL